MKGVQGGAAIRRVSHVPIGPCGPMESESGTPGEFAPPWCAGSKGPRQGSHWRFPPMGGHGTPLAAGFTGAAVGPCASALRQEKPRAARRPSAGHPRSGRVRRESAPRPAAPDASRPASPPCPTGPVPGGSSDPGSREGSCRWGEGSARASDRGRGGRPSC